MTRPALWRRIRSTESGRAGLPKLARIRTSLSRYVERRSSAHHPVEDFLMAVVRRLILALVVGLLWAARSSAQNPVPPTGTITGRVVDAETQQPVGDVSIVVEGTRTGAGSAPDGSFALVGVPAGSQTVRARRIGFSGPVQIVVVP